jgi:Double zinc ribbon/FHA domain
MICQNCGATEPEGQAFCDQCGKKLIAPLPSTLAAAGGMVAPQASATGIRCPTCGQTNLPDSNFCETCGSPLTRAGASAPFQTPSPQPPIQPVDSSPKTIAMPGVPAFEPPTQPVQRLAVPEYPPPAAPPLQSTQRAPGFSPPQPGHLPTERMSVNDASGAGPAATIRYEQAIGPQPKLVAENGIVISLKEGQTTWTIGREDPVSNVYPDIDLTPFDPDYTASRRHAQLALNGAQPVLTSVTRTNWTKLNGQRMIPEQPAPIKPGDRIEFARVVMIFQM